MTTQPPVLLASSSVYRRDLLARILPSFETAVPDVDETARAGEPADVMAARLADLKARRCAADRPEAIVIGSDQVPVLDDHMLRKPGNRHRAIRQLSECSERAVVFLTAVAVIGPGGRAETHLDQTIVRFRRLSAEEIERYVDAEQPFDCAGSFRAESLGIALFESIESRDPTALQGLPLIWLAGCLSRFGIPLP